MATYLSPLKIIQTYSSEEWETFIQEWTDCFSGEYKQVVPLAGPGDKGRDVVAYVGEPTEKQCEWDNYQCKHYDHPLHPTDVYVELGKLCVYTHRGDYNVPRRYRFVSPRGIGPKLHDLLKKPEELRKELIANWDSRCAKKISDSEQFSLVGDLKSYVESFDFGIVWFLTPQELLKQHAQTKHWHRRFKIDPPRRPPVDAIPEDILPLELPYTKRLLEAYTDHLKQPFATIADLTNLPALLSHFRRSRGYFFSAEALARFSRDNFSPGAFEETKQHVYDGVVDVTEQRHSDGYDCVLKVAEVASGLPLPHSDLFPYVGPADKIGICHHLANDDRLCWCSYGRR